MVCPLFFLFLFSSSNLMSQIGCLPYFHTLWPIIVRCRSETYCRRLAENTGRKNSPKICRLGTIAQLCPAIIFATIRYTCTYHIWAMHVPLYHAPCKLHPGWQVWVCGQVMLFNMFFSDCRYVPLLRRYSPTKLCDGAQMAIFWRFNFASCISASRLAVRFRPKATPCVLVWQTSNLRQLSSLGEEKRR